MKIEFDHIIKTCGDGYWSQEQKWVLCTEIELIYWEDDGEDAAFGELCVYFNTSSWDTKEDGLIYTDSEFAEQVKVYLNEMGLAGDDVGYSEQGMQGRNYVSFDAGDLFVKSWIKKYGKQHVSRTG